MIPPASPPTGTGEPRAEGAVRRARPTRVDVLAAGLAIAAALLVGASLPAGYLAHRRALAAPGVAPPDWLALLDVNSEANVPTWFTVVLWCAPPSPPSEQVW